MSCQGESNLQGFKYPSNYKALPNEREELYTVAWGIVKDEVERLMSQGWAADKKGNKSLSLKYYKAVNQYYYLIHLGIIVRNYLQDTSVLGKPCATTDAEEKFNLACIEANLLCLSKTYGTNYSGAWKSITEAFGIGRETDKCGECCVGIGEMIIGGDDECTAFIIGPCQDPDELVPPYGEFAPCEFKIDEFVKPVGKGIYDNCE